MPLIQSGSDIVEMAVVNLVSARDLLCLLESHLIQHQSTATTESDACHVTDTSRNQHIQSAYSQALPLVEKNRILLRDGCVLCMLSKAMWSQIPPFQLT